ncbi:hypothetical protein NG791_11405 [Laspinema sp. D1]|uniref:hypothetical protein n=1 Tax=Laspinema palackyanum TaxID=3231601 RepID=UPI00348FD584|nr:hypothetical protein [Laspinema sp. D2b]
MEFPNAGAGNSSESDKKISGLIEPVPVARSSITHSWGDRLFIGRRSLNFFSLNQLKKLV